MSKTATIPWGAFSDKHKRYIKAALNNRMCVAEGAIRSGKTIDHCIIAAAYLETTPDIYHLASGSTIGNAKLNIGVCNGFGLEALFRGRCRWGKCKDNEALFIRTQTGEKAVIFAGGAKADSYKRILGNSYGLWIATEINEHYDSQDSRTSFLKVANGRQIAAQHPFTLWDLNPSNPRASIYEDYIDKYARDGLEGGYLYEHFTIKDNATITPQRLKEIQSQYDPNTVWYRRDILGERCVAEGLIYRTFADDPERFMIDSPPDDVLYAVIGLDFGGNGSANAINLTGISRDMRRVYTLDEWWFKGAITPTDLEDAFVAFARRAQERFRVFEAYMDSAEQTLINGMRAAARKARLPIDIKNALKGPINDRIRFYNRLHSAGQYRIMRHCRRTIDAFCTAIYDPKKLKDERLDDGTINIDSLDAQEYSTEAVMNDIITLG